MPALLVALCLACGAAARVDAAEQDRPKRALTVADTIQTTRFLSNVTRYAVGDTHYFRRDAWVSPDGQRYLIVLVRGDVGKNGNWIELLSGGLRSMSDAASIQSVARFFTTAKGPEPLTFRYDYRITWLPDSEQVALLVDDADERAQVAIVNTRTGSLQFRTSRAERIVNYDAGVGGSVFYVVQSNDGAKESRDLMQQGFVVTNADAYSFLNRDFANNGRRSYEFYLSLPGAAQDRRVDLTARQTPDLVHFSPDARKVLVDALPREIPREWAQYRGDAPVGSWAAQAQEPGGGRAWLLRQLYVVDVERATAHPLWRAPKLPEANSVTWSPRGDAVLLCPTYLPMDEADAAGLDGAAAAVVNVDSGEFQQLPLPSGRGSGFRGGSWQRDGSIELINDTTTLIFRKRNGRWRRVAERRSAHTSDDAVRLEVRQDMNTPPKLFALGASANEARLILDPNPALLADFTLGRAAAVEWKDQEDRAWRGRLYYPVGYVAGQRYGLVVQTHGVASPEEFSLYGWAVKGYASGLGPAGASAFAAQALANRGLAVLQVEDKDIHESRSFAGTPREPEVYAAAYEAAAQHFIDAGIADRDRIGISGFSRSGWYVEYALTHPRFPYAAAMLSDNFNGSYMAGALVGTTGGLSEVYAQINGAPGYGPGLKTWLDRAPGFNAHRVVTPLRMQAESGGLPLVLGRWELFNALRLMKKPVELYVVPDIDRGAHNLQNPGQVLAAQEGVVDWFDFWLNAHETDDPRKAEQYSRWRELKVLRDAQIRNQTSTAK